MNFKEKSEKIILDFLYKNRKNSYTVKEIGQYCFARNLQYFHNVTEFLRSLNEQDLVTFTFNGTEMKRRDIDTKVMGGEYKYKSGVGIESNENILDLWKKETVKFFEQNQRKAFTTTQIARGVCGRDLEFINTQSIVMNELESEGTVVFFHQGKEMSRKNNGLNGSWMLKKHCYTLSR